MDGHAPAQGHPDTGPLLGSELHSPYRPKGALLHFRPNFLGCVADLALRSLAPYGAGGIQWEQGTVNIYGAKKENRLTAFYGDAGATYAYSGRRLKAIPWCKDKSSVLSTIRKMVEAATGETFNCCLLNLYRDGRDSIGKHSDNTSALRPGSSIAAVSLGATRAFCVAPKAPGGSSAIPLSPHTIAASHGSLTVMGGAMQQSFLHWVPADLRVGGVRISLTYRRAR